MATSNKAQDPAAAALLAIEEALNLGAAGQGAGPAEANPIGPTSADKAKGRSFGKREAAPPRPGLSRPPGDAAWPLEQRAAAIDEGYDPSPYVELGRRANSNFFSFVVAYLPLLVPQGQKWAFNQNP